MKNKRRLTVNIIISLVATLIIVWFYPHPEANHFKYEEGKPWNYAQLIAPFDIPIHPDSITLKNARDTLNAKFIPIYDFNNLKGDSIARSLPDSKGSSVKSRLEKEIRTLYSRGVVDSETRSKIASGAMPRIRVLQKKVISEQPATDFLSPKEVYEYLDRIFRLNPDDYEYFLSVNLSQILEPNFTVNKAETKRHFENEYLTLTADRGMILQGQSIIGKGDIISPQTFIILKTYEEMLAERNPENSSNNIVLWIGQFLFVTMLIGGLFSYFYFFVPKVYNRIPAMIFIMCLIVLFFLLSTWVGEFVHNGIYIVPLMIVPMLVLVFFDERSAIMTSLVVTLICAGITTFALEFIFLQFCATLAVIYSMRDLSRRAQLFRTSMVIMIVYLVGYVALELLMNGSLHGISHMMLLYLFINSALTSMSYILMFAVERVFGFVSTVTLIELTDINNPLLSRLSEECPGTFQHSLAVSNLAADAGLKVGANVKLIRAGALYHDIGKLNNPAFFTENQRDVNPHDTLPPERSASIIIRHVTDGLKLAEKSGLPESIRNFIREHHGRGMAKYFYYNACKEAPEGTKVDPEPYTYPGPNPQSLELSILMMADSVEAASRSLPEHSQAAITDLVNKIIDGQIKDGLHNESPISFRDIDIIKKTFVKRLLTMYHSRVAYPGAPKNAQKPEDSSSSEKKEGQ